MNAAAPTPGDVIGDYEILEKIGGNMGWVFKVRHREMNNRVRALKLLPRNWLADPDRLARFKREIQLLSDLDHPNLVAATDVRSVDSWYFVVMEWIDGVDLNRLVKEQGPLPVDAACEAARQAALGLRYAHGEKKLIHRDIKPSNLMLTRGGTVKVIDMGLALARDDASPELTKTGDVMGTMHYCSPEQARDASSVDVRADIYSLGCTLYYLLTGKAPYSDRTNASDLIQAHRNDPFPKLTHARPDAPVRLEAVLGRMTAKNPADRFPNPAEVAEALKSFAEGADLKSLVPPKPDRYPMPPTTRPDESPKRLWPRRVALFAGIPAIVGSAVLILNRRKPDSGMTQTASLAASPQAAPVVVLMDTTADKGIYDEENKGKGITNAEELAKQLRNLPLGAIHSVNISIESSKRTWRGESRVLNDQPALVIIHRSAFFHPVNAEVGLGYPDEFVGDVGKMHKWQTLYEVMDDKLVSFIGYVGTVSPRTSFLIYSRGTDKNWITPGFQEQWVEEIAARFPGLTKDRVSTMTIPTERATFTHRETAEEMRRAVKRILKL